MSKILVIAIIVLLVGIVGYLVTQNVPQKGADQTSAPYQVSAQGSQQTAIPTTQDYTSSSTIVAVSTPEKGYVYYDATSKKAIYTYDKDTKDKSNCTGQCLVNWPPFIVGDAAGSLPEGFSTFKRDDGGMQYTYNGMPLYYYIKDKNPGDVTGDGVGGVWHLVVSQHSAPATSSAPTSAPASSSYTY
jgi:predicted lipoprotein with Yx(FWY)xxD motif